MPRADTFTLAITTQPDDDPAAIAHLSRELGKILETANACANAARINVRRAKGIIEISHARRRHVACVSCSGVGWSVGQCATCGGTGIG